jgi:NAD(P)-dependent dehydrogenase (short-subunit alcohol dehydrogenase family)
LYTVNMSSLLKSQAASHASFLTVAKRLSPTVPQIPQDITLAGKTALVTGSNVGLGLECCRHFLKLRPRRLIMAVRSLQKGEAAAETLRCDFPDTPIDVWQLDHASFRSVQAFAARCDRDLDRLDVAVLNAGLGSTKFVRTGEGRRRELTLQVNYLSTALLAVLLLPKMRPTATSPAPGRLTIISSDAGLGVRVQPDKNGSVLDPLDRPETFRGFMQYAYSKLLITMFTAKLAEAVNPADVIINCCNPAATKGTAFGANIEARLLKAVLSTWTGWMGRTAEEAARMYVWASVVLGKESHGSFTDWEIRA